MMLDGLRRFRSVLFVNLTTPARGPERRLGMCGKSRLRVWPRTCQIGGPRTPPGAGSTRKICLVWNGTTLALMPRF